MIFGAIKIRVTYARASMHEVSVFDGVLLLVRFPLDVLLFGYMNFKCPQLKDIYRILITDKGIDYVENIPRSCSGGGYREISLYKTEIR